MGYIVPLVSSIRIAHEEIKETQPNWGQSRLFLFGREGNNYKCKIIMIQQKYSFRPKTYRESGENETDL